MDQLEKVHHHAVEHTKRKVHEDINRFLETKEEMPSFETYKRERQPYIEQIWTNVWINKASNDVSKRGKRAFLTDIGYDVEGVSRKIINKLFRDEIKLYMPFDVIGWLDERYAENHEYWASKYQKSRSAYIEREEERILKEKRSAIEREIEITAYKKLEKRAFLYFLYVRHLMGEHIAKVTPEITARVEKVWELYEEPTGAVLFGDDWRSYKHGRVDETYYHVFDQLIDNKLYGPIAKEILDDLPKHLREQYDALSDQTLTSSTLMWMIMEEIEEFKIDWLSHMQEEYIDDLLLLAHVPFDEERHQAMYEESLEKRKQREAEELAEIERQKEEEERMLEDIFGREYRPQTGRDIRYVLHIGETNTGKTHHALKQMKKGKTGLYLAPLRLLALEVYEKLNNEGLDSGLKTGEEEKDLDDATHLSCTVEMFHERDFFDVVVIDEAQMITDKDRGFSWYKAITNVNANEVHIIGSNNAKSIVLELLGDANIDIYDYERDIPLQVESSPFKIQQTEKGDALVCFSRKRVLETASKLRKDGYSVSMIYGSMPPETRKKQMERFIKGETTVIVSTDAIGMGLNLPIRRIVFLENEKFDGTKRRRLTSQEVKQIAGRAGRKGIYNVGKVAFTKDIQLMTRLIEQPDEPVQSFAIAPTNNVFERFQKYYRDLGTFFELWDKFDSPYGTIKATLSEERELYELIRGTEIEGRLSMMDLYGFLHLPFSKKEMPLILQWKNKMKAIARGGELPEPKIKTDTLEDLELTYKSLGLHLLFLYRLGRQTEAIYWERVREEISDDVHEHLKTDMTVYNKKCKYCGRSLPFEFPHTMCDDCHSKRYRRRFTKS